MPNRLDPLIAEVARSRTIKESAIALINGFAARLVAAGTDPVQLEALRADIAETSDALAAAVEANTPVAPPEPEPEPPPSE